MLLQRWILTLALFLGKYVTGTSIAEEINFEVSNMKESAKNDPQIYLLQEMIENEQEGISSDHVEDAEISPSEIVETHLLPEDTSDSEDINAQVKRPRRRRRRRRRKRPKPIANPEELDSYYTIPEEELKRKPIKYRPQDNVDVLIPESSNLPRRRNIKRRRRPLKKPMVDDDPATAEGGNTEYVNNMEEQNAENPSNYETEENQEKSKTKIKHLDENHSQLENTVKEETGETKLSMDTSSQIQKKVKESDSTYEIPKGNLKVQHTSEENESMKIATTEEYYKSQPNLNKDDDFRTVEGQDGLQKLNNQNKETEEIKVATFGENLKSGSYKENDMLKVVDESHGYLKRRKRPFLKTENVTIAEISKAEQMTETPQLEHTNHVQEVNKIEIKKDVTKENHKMKTEDKIKANDTNKKSDFKLRRLPPISAILRRVKTRPVKNDTAPIKPPFKSETTTKLKESISNEILTHAAVNEIQKVSPNQSETYVKITENQTDTRKTEELEESDFADTTNNSLTKGEVNDFEFPIIIYTEQKQSQKETSTPIPSSTFLSNTTDSSAFIYIPCNHTINDVLRNGLNLTNETVTTAANKFSNLTRDQSRAENVRTNRTVLSYNTTKNDSLNIFKSMATNGLEKLLQQTETEMLDSNNSKEKSNESAIIKNETQTTASFPQFDARALESHLSYLFQNKTNSNVSKLTFVKDSPEEKFSPSEINFREPKWFQNTSKHKHEINDDHKNEIPFLKSYSGSTKELIITYTSTGNPNFAYNEIDSQETVFRENEFPLHLRNNSFRRKMSQDNAMYKKNHAERKKLPLAVKSAIIISGAILALAVLGFFALLLSCKIRQAKSRMKCHRELYREQFQNSEFRQSSRSTSPVVSKSNYNGRSFTNNIQSNVASNRNYYLWQTLRKTFQYD